MTILEIDRKIDRTKKELRQTPEPRNRFALGARIKRLREMRDTQALEESTPSR